MPKFKPGLIVRQAAWDVLQAVAAGAYADIALDRILKRYSFSNSDRALVTELSYGAIRQRYFLDCWIDFLGKVPARKQPPLLRWLLHIGLYQVLKMQKIPSSAAINTTVELAKINNLKSLAPVVNALLRTALRMKDRGQSLPIPQKAVLRIAQEQSLPAWIAKVLIDLKDEKAAEQIARSFNVVPKIDLRVNCLKEDRESLMKKFDKFGIKTKFIDCCPQGLEVLSGDGDMREWPGYKQGNWCVQDRSSQLIAPLLDPQPGESVLDACSAPGGKATHIAELVRNIGEIWAVDRSEKRLNRLLENSNRLGSSSIRTLTADASKLLELRPDWKGYFHKILLDAPCSGLGTLARHPDARWKMTSEKVKELVSLQTKLFKALVPLLRPGGRLIYSTCTIHPSENSDQLSKFIKIFPEFKVQYQKQMWPIKNDSGDGFYVAVLDYISMIE